MEDSNYFCNIEVLVTLGDYQALSDNAYRQWQKVTPEIMGNKQLNIYKELLKKS